jgi:high-affinity iron transporter
MPAFLLALREGLEAALIVSIMLGALRRLDQARQARFVWLGVASALLASAAITTGIDWIGAEFEGRFEAIFEGSTLLLAAAVLTWMIFWMQRQGRGIGTVLSNRVGRAIHQGAETGAQRGITRSWRSGLSLFSVAFLAVFREGVELALFLVAAAYATSQAAAIVGATAGLVGAAALGGLLFAGSVRLNVRRFFLVTGVLLMIFAAGMVAAGVRGLINGDVLPGVISPLWNTTPILDENSGLGRILKALFGYDSNPALTEVVLYVGYYALVGGMLWVQRHASLIRRLA